MAKTDLRQCIFWLLFLLYLGTGAGWAATATLPNLDQRVAQLESAAQAAAGRISTGDNAWMLASSALVLMMTAPGLVLFYGGLVRSKNVLATMMHSLLLMALVSLVWAVYGYPHEPMPPHNVVLSLIGCGLLWVGWFGFNAGSITGMLLLGVFANPAVNPALASTFQLGGKP